MQDVSTLMLGPHKTRGLEQLQVVAIQRKTGRSIEQFRPPGSVNGGIRSGFLASSGRLKDAKTAEVSRSYAIF